MLWYSNNHGSGIAPSLARRWNTSFLLPCELQWCAYIMEVNWSIHSLLWTIYTAFYILHRTKSTEILDRNHAMCLMGNTASIQSKSRHATPATRISAWSVEIQFVLVLSSTGAFHPFWIEICKVRTLNSYFKYLFDMHSLLWRVRGYY